MKQKKEHLKRTNLVTHEYGRLRRVYQDDKGQLFFITKFEGHNVINGTYRQYCREESKK